MAWSLITLLLLGSGLFHGIGAAEEENLPSAQVVGSVLCAPCFNRGFSRTRHFISGASVLLECVDLGFWKEVTTDESGKFDVHLPPLTSEDAETTHGCMVKLIKSNNPGCDAVSSRASLRLTLNRQGPQVLPVGVLAFTPREQPSSCARKLTRRGPLESISKKVSTNSKSARRTYETSDYPPSAKATVTSPAVLGSTTLPPLPFFSFPPLLAQQPLPPTLAAALQPTSTYFPFPPLPQPHFPWQLSPSPSLPPWFRLPLPQLAPIQPRLPFPLTPLPSTLPFPLPPLPPKVPFPLPPLPGFALPPSPPSA